MEKIIMIITAALLTAGICYADTVQQQFLGNWVGAIRVMEDEIECEIEFVEEGGQIIGFMSIPMQGMRGYPLTDLSIDYPNVSFNLISGGVTASFEGSMKTTYISGTFHQQGVNGLFHLVRGEKTEYPQQEVIPGESEISVRTQFGNIYGSLVVPEKEGDFPVVLIIAGSGPTDRDGNNPMMGAGFIYRDLALQLQKNGIASLRFDKRGVGASSGALMKEEDLRFDYYAADVVLLIQKLREYDKFSSIILAGHSEGSLLALIAGQREKVDGVISIAGMGRTVDDILIEQLSNQPEKVRDEALEVIAKLKQGIIVQNVKKELEAIFRPSVQPFLLSMMRYDPREEIKKIDVPILIVQGTTDLQVTEKDAELLHNANKNSKMVIIEGMNHVMRTSTKDMQSNFMTYGTPGLPFSDNLIKTITEFIKDLD